VLKEALSRLEEAEREGSSERIGQAHMGVVSVLEEMLESAGDFRAARRLYGQMLEHVDETLRAYEGQAPAWRVAQIRLLKAAVLVEMARREGDPEERASQVGGAIDHCHLATNGLRESSETRHLVLADWHLPVVAILLQLRDLVDEEAQQALDGMIESYSEILGESLTSDLQQQKAGRDFLFSAYVLAALADLEDDPRNRLETMKSQMAGALEAAETLRHSSDLELAHEAYALVAETSAGLANLTAVGQDRDRRLACSACGTESSPGKRFCTRCGVRLEGAAGSNRAVDWLACTECGQPTDPSRRYCARCGTALDQRS
jgi:hypothetical protein